MVMMDEIFGKEKIINQRPGGESTTSGHLFSYDVSVKFNSTILYFDYLVRQ